MSLAWHAIRDQLVRSSSTLGFQRSFQKIRRIGSPIRPFRDPTALLDALHGNHIEPDAKNLILRMLVRAAQAENAGRDCALTLTLLALWPGLDAVLRRARARRLAAADDMAADVLARATEAVRCLDLRRVTRIAATILRNIERDMLRAGRREVDRAALHADLDPDEIGGGDWQPGPHHLLGDLRRLLGRDGDLVMRVAVQGFSQRDAAEEFGLSEAAVRKRYQRASRRLRTALQEIV